MVAKNIPVRIRLPNKPQQRTNKTARGMKYRKLRITWSVAWGVVAVLLCVLWVRSYTTWDRCYWPGSNLGVQLNSDAGHIVLVVGPHVPSSNIVSFFVASRPTLVTGKTFYKD